MGGPTKTRGAANPKAPSIDVGHSLMGPIEAPGVG